MKAKMYMGVLIVRADSNASGIRWNARLDNGDMLRADTLQGIRQLISMAKRSKEKWNSKWNPTGGITQGL